MFCSRREWLQPRRVYALAAQNQMRAMPWVVAPSFSRTLPRKMSSVFVEMPSFLAMSFCASPMAIISATCFSRGVRLLMSAWALAGSMPKMLLGAFFALDFAMFGALSYCVSRRDVPPRHTEDFGREKL